MNLNKYISSESDNYYIPFLDLMSGVVFILMIILSTEIINIKYVDSEFSSYESTYKNLNKIELFKKKFVSSLSMFLTKNNIKNIISRDYNNILIQQHNIFQDKSLSLSKEGKNIASKLSEAFNKNLFYKVDKDEQFKKNIDYIKSISINVFSPLLDKFKNVMISKSFVFYGYLVNINPNILLFSSASSPRLFRISDTSSFPDTLLKDLEKNHTDMIRLNFEFCYPEDDKVIW